MTVLIYLTNKKVLGVDKGSETDTKYKKDAVNAYIYDDFVR